jgi:site-specific recombinase XerD
MTPLAPHLAAFLRERLPLERAVSPHTLDSYSYAFQLLLEFAGRRLKQTPCELQLEQIDVALVLAFLEHLETGRSNSACTRNARLVAIRSFFHYVEHRVPSALDQVRRILAIPAKNTDAKLVHHLAPDEMQAILDAPDPTTRDGLRDRAMLHLAFAAGLRASELLGLRLDELTLPGIPSIRVRGKGRRERGLPLWKETTSALRAWLAVRPASAACEIFLNARGQPLSRDGLAWILRKHAATAAQQIASLRGKRISPHVLRHTCAMTILRATGDLRRVAIWLGHAHLQTTEVYTRADPTEKLELLQTVSPPHLRPGRFRPPDRLLALLAAARTPQDYPESKMPAPEDRSPPEVPNSG